MKKQIRITILIAAVFSLLLSGCKSARHANQNREYGVTSDLAYDYPMEDYLADGEFAYAAEESAAAYSKAVPMASNSEPSEQKRMIQKSASINIQVMDPLDAAEKLIALTEQTGGFVVSSSSTQERYSGDIYLPRANLTIRVPSERLNETLDFIENLTSDTGKYVSNKRVYGVDITSEYVDTNSRLTSLEKTLTKLYEILDTAQDAEEALEVYNRIAQVESDIEVLKGQVKYMQESVALSSIDVQISSIRPAPTQTVTSWSVGDVIKDAFEALLDSGKSVIEFIIYLVIVIIPILVLAAIPVALIFLVIRKIIRSKKAKTGKAVSGTVTEDRLSEVKKN